MLLDRDRQAGRFLEWKVRLFSVAAVVALAGIYLDNRWWTGAAVVILMVGMLLKFLPSDPRDSEETEETEEG